MFSRESKGNIGKETVTGFIDLNKVITAKVFFR